MSLNKFSEIISATRRRRGISQKQAALELGISQALLSHYEKGIRECSLDFLVKLAEYYGVSCDYLLGHSTAKTSRTAAAQRQRSLTRTLETVLLLSERSDDGMLKDNLTEYYKFCLYRGLKLFDGVCDGLYFEGEDICETFAESLAEIAFAKAADAADGIKDMELPMHEGSLEYPSQIINDVEATLYEKGLL